MKCLPCTRERGQVDLRNDPWDDFVFILRLSNQDIALSPGLPELSSLLPLRPSGQTRAVESQCHGRSKEDHRSEGRLARERPAEAQVVSLHMLLGHRTDGLWEVWQVCCPEVLGPQSPTGP